MVRAVRSRADREPRCADSASQSDPAVGVNASRLIPRACCSPRRRPQSSRMPVLDAFDFPRRERQKFGAALGREPTVVELAERLDRPHAAVSAAAEAHASRVPRSLDSTTDDAEYERAEARTTIERLTSILDPRARDVLRVRLQHDLRQWELAAATGCSQMQVSRIIRTSLERLPAHACVACGGWSMSDTTEGATA